MPTHIVVVGAGVSGLTSALLLSRSKSNIITVIAKDMPGDYNAEYASPWAGANVLPMASEKNSLFERRTFPELQRLAREVPEAGIHFQGTFLLQKHFSRRKNMIFDSQSPTDVCIYRRQSEIDKIKAGTFRSDGLFLPNPWYQSMVDNFRELNIGELPKGAVSGCTFTSVQINPMIYLPWLIGQCKSNGVVIKRGVIDHIMEAAALSHSGAKADIIVNSTGLRSCKLGGVMDQNVIPARGQVVVLRNEINHMMSISGTDDGNSELCYMMTRADGGGTIVGGSYEPGNWNPEPDPNQSVRIMSRIVELVPELSKGNGVRGLDIARHAVGFRPFRHGGVRIEKEKIDGVWVVHHYGHGGWGYQASYGTAERVVELVNEIRGHHPKL
ncbi:unnamed protein product [Clonostachys byssicola]|uniref:FAD dependent oxidoreductase domain-containing protein n=1 Tax=Clonostachys byssicola TaxID=160290 RepID=A0A9N9U7V1_9HYPO|nr:unnamed protein product [Clonostachys byssicola]